MKNFKSRAFTLIELLVVIAIVGILSGLVFVQLNGAIGASQDAKRKADISTIRKALLNYSVFNGNTYPIADCPISSSCTVLYDALVPEYLPSLPTDPASGNYTYTSDGTSFTATANLSNSTTYSYNSITGFSGGTPSAEAWLSGYSKRKAVAVNAPSSLSNYQVVLTVTYDSDMQVDFDDLRFTTSDKTTLMNYWIESKTNSSIAKIWIKVPTLTSGSNTIYMYYGNSSAVAASNGFNTFDFFDDFNTGSAPSSHWTVVEGTWSINSQQLYQSATTDRFLQIVTDYTGTDYIVEADVEILDEYENNMGALLVARSNPAVYANCHSAGLYRTYSTAVKNFYLSAYGKGGTCAFATWYKARLVANGSNFQLYINNSLTLSGTSALYPSGYAGLAAQAAHARFDNFLVRKYASSDPTSAFNTEESN